MSPTETPPQTFPAPIGGVPFNSDFSPSILFAILYASINLLGIYRMVRSSSRTLVLIGVLIFTTERIVIYSLRAMQAHDPSERASNFLTKYWQMAYAVGYVSILHNVIAILSCLLVNATLDVAPGTYKGTSDYPLLNRSESYQPLEGDDQARMRSWYRQTCRYLNLLAWVPFGIGMAAGLLYASAETDSNRASTVYTLRYIAGILAFSQILTIQALSIWSYFCVPRIRRSRVLIVVLIVTLLLIVSIYRLVVMRLRTTSLTSRGPHSLNDTGSKITFYIFHASPEFLAAAIFSVLNIREMFGTGLLGGGLETKKPQTTAKTDLTP